MTGSPRWLVRDQVLVPPGGRRFAAAYASLAAAAAVALAAVAAISPLVAAHFLVFLLVGEAVAVGEALALALGVGAGLGATALAPLANP